MQEIQLLLPVPGHKPAAWQFRQEHFDAGETLIHGDGGLDEAESYEQWLEKLGRDLAPEPDSGRVPGRTYFAFLGEEIVGVLQIRHYLNDFLLECGGHIGYGVRPTQRGNGYGTKMLARALEICRELGIMRVLVTCDRENIASARVIEKNGGVFEDERAQPGEPDIIVRRYWISL